MTEIEDALVPPIERKSVVTPADALAMMYRSEDIKSATKAAPPEVQREYAALKVADESLVELLYASRDGRQGMLFVVATWSQLLNSAFLGVAWIFLCACSYVLGGSFWMPAATASSAQR